MVTTGIAEWLVEYLRVYGLSASDQPVRLPQLVFRPRSVVEDLFTQHFDNLI